MKLSIIFLTALAVFYIPTISMAGPKRFVGVEKCKRCHNKKSKGHIYTSWRKSKHSHAFKSLQQKSATEKVTALGLTGDPSRLEECLICHSVNPFISKTRFTKQFDIEDGVQCETCHGPGSLYAKKRIMEKIALERTKNMFITAKKTGLILVSRSSCGSQCHRADRVYDGKTYHNPCHSSLRKLKTLIKDVMNPFH